MSVINKTPPLPIPLELVTQRLVKLPSTSCQGYAMFLGHTNDYNKLRGTSV